MKKYIFLIMLFALIVSPALAATFTANGDITVSNVVGDVTADMLILNGSTSDSWKFNSGVFTITNPGAFKVGSSDSSVQSIKITQGGSNVVCAKNITPGTSYATLPTTAATYTIIPSTTTDCTSLCAAVSNAAALNSFPTCGAATCDTGYTLSGSGSNATCVSAVSAGGAVIIPPLSIIKKEKPAEKKTISEEQNKKSKADASAGKLTAGVQNNTLEQISADANIAASGDINEVIKAINVERNLAAEINYSRTIVAKITRGSGITAAARNAITNFVTYGTKTTQKLGAGERAGVVDSFKAAFGRLPESPADWLDAIKIANGRWPGKIGVKGVNRAKINFRIVYLRAPNKYNTNDDAAITIMAYGLRPANRNLNSEKAAIKIFKNIYGYAPEKTTAWNVVRAIAYSGATR